MSGTALRRSARRGALAALLVLGSLGGCGRGAPQLHPLAGEAVVLAFGDSLTHGTGASPEESYPARLAARIGRKVVNAGVPGEVSADGLRRLPAVLERVEPALVILCHGGNDLLRRLDLAETEDNLREMVRLARAHGAEVVLVGVPAPGLLLGTADLYERVAEDLEVPIEDEILADLLGENRYKSDAVHPNAAGYARLAEALEDLLGRAGAL